MKRSIRPLKILFLSDRFPPKFFGGGEISAFYLAKALAKRGHSVSIITQPLGTDLSFGKLNVIQEGLMRFGIGPKIILESAKAKIIAGLLNKKYSNLLEAADVIHAHDMRSTLILSHLKSANRKSVATVRDMWPLCGARYPYLFNEGTHACDSLNSIFTCPGLTYLPWSVKIPLGLVNLYNLSRRQQSLRKIRRVIYISSFLADITGKYLATEGLIIGNPIPSDWVMGNGSRYKRKDKPTILYCGTIDEAKGVNVLLQAIKQVYQTTPCLLELIGGGNIDKYRRMAQSLGITDHVRFWGPLPHQEVESSFARADIIVQPSIMPEGLGRTVLQGMAMGKAVIGTDQGGIRDLIEDGVNGFLVDSGDPVSLTKKIELLLKDKDLREKAGRQAQKFVTSNFAPDIIAAKHEAVYRSLL